MSSLDVTRAELALAVMYLNKAETRDKICRTIQYGSRFLSNGEPGTAQDVEKSVSLARKVFRLLKVSMENSTLVEIGEIGRLSLSMKKLEKELKNTNKYQNEQYRSKVQESNERSLAFVKAALDIVVAVGLLQLAPKKVTPRVSGAVGFVSSLISCYQLLPSPPKAKTT